MSGHHVGLGVRLCVGSVSVEHAGRMKINLP